jgi:hypothetical protein
MLKQALLAPIRTSDALPTLLIGTALVVLSAVVVSAAGFLIVQTPVGLALAPVAVLLPLVLLGYELRVLRAGVRGERGAPSFVNWSGLVRGGVASLAVTLGYLAPAGVVAGVALALWVGFHDAAGVVPRSTLGREAARYGGTALLAGYGLLLLPLRPAALSVYVATGRLRSAFALRRVLGVLTTGRFLLGWALGSLVVLLGVIVFPFAFYARVVAHSLYGRAAAPTLDAGLAGGVAPDADRVLEPGADPGVQTGGDLPGDGDAPGSTLADPASLAGATDRPGAAATSEPERTLDAYDPDELSVAPGEGDAEADRLADPGAAFASFDPGDEEDEEDEEDEADDADAGVPGRADGEDADGDSDGDDDGFEWGRVE